MYQNGGSPNEYIEQSDPGFRARANHPCWKKQYTSTYHQNRIFRKDRGNCAKHY